MRFFLVYFIIGLISGLIMVRFGPGSRDSRNSEDDLVGTMFLCLMVWPAVVIFLFIIGLGKFLRWFNSLGRRSEPNETDRPQRDI